MANDLSVQVAAIIAAQGATVLRKNSVTPRYVNTDWGSEVKQQGDTIKVPVSHARSTATVTPAATPSAGADTTTTSVDIALSNWKKASFHITSKQMAEIANNPAYIGFQTEECFSALADLIDAAVLANYTKVFGYVGTAGTTPFGTPGVNDVIDIRTALTNQLAPQNNRAFMLNPDAEGAALKLAAFNQVQNSGDLSVIREGAIGRKLGFNFDVTQNIPTHTAGTITTGLIAKAATAVAVGATSLVATTAASTGACALKAGDVIVIGTGSTARTYTLSADATEASAATDVTLTLNNPIRVALTGSEAIAVKASHVVNLAFHRNAFALAMRQMAFDPKMMPAGTVSQMYTDPISNIPFRVDIIPGYEMMTVEAKVLYGTACIRPELAARLAG